MAAGDALDALRREKNSDRDGNSWHRAPFLHTTLSNSTDQPACVREAAQQREAAACAVGVIVVSVDVVVGSDGCGDFCEQHQSS